MIMLDIYMLLTGGLEVDVFHIISLYFLSYAVCQKKFRQTVFLLACSSDGRAIDC